MDVRMLYLPSNNLKHVKSRLSSVDKRDSFPITCSLSLHHKRQNGLLFQHLF